MVLTGKEKAVATFVITLVLGVIGTVLAFSGLPADVKPFLDLAVAIITVVGSTLGVYATTNTGQTVQELPAPAVPVAPVATVPVAAAPAPVASTDSGLTDPAVTPTSTVGDA